MNELERIWKEGRQVLENSMGFVVTAELSREQVELPPGHPLVAFKFPVDN